MKGGGVEATLLPTDLVLIRKHVFQQAKLRNCSCYVIHLTLAHITLISQRE